MEKHGTHFPISSGTVVFQFRVKNCCVNFENPNEFQRKYRIRVNSMKNTWTKNQFFLSVQRRTQPTCFGQEGKIRHTPYHTLPT